jgi:predicted phage terminase large subunit-like protein
MHPTLEIYQKVLPNRDFAALNAWVSTFYPFQQEWLLDPSEYAIQNKARQIGLSHTSGALGVIWGAFHGETTTIISKGQLEADEVLEKAQRHARVLSKLGSRMAVLGKDAAGEISFASGGRLLALPSSGGRGFTGNVILDEFAYHEAKNDEKVWDAALAVTMLGNFRARVISTPNGVANKFAEVWRESAFEEFGWNRHETSIEKAIAQGYPVDIKKCWKLAAGNKLLFQQLFQCGFVDPESRFLFAQVAKGKNRFLELPPSTAAARLKICIGLDFAYTAKTSADYSAAVVLAQIGDLYFVLDVLRIHCEPREFRARIPVLLESYRKHFASIFCGAYVAATEAGGIEFIREANIPIEAMQATIDKFQRAIPVATAWNEGRIFLPHEAPWLDAFTAEVTGFTGTKKDRHDDMVDALAAAFDCLGVPQGVPTLTTAAQPRWAQSTGRGFG